MTGPAPAPPEAPLTYPGVLPAGPSLLLPDGELAPIQLPGPGCRLDQAWVAGRRNAPLDAVLHDVGATPMERRHVLLAVGSNAGEAQLRRKFDGRADAVIPILPCTVQGVGVAFVPHAAPYGSIPYTAVRDPGLACRTFVQFVDDAQLRVLEASEGSSYRQELLTGIEVRLDNGDVRTSALAYVSRRGALVEDDGALVPLVSQAEVLSRIRAWVPDRLPEEPQRAVELLAADGRLRDQVHDELRRRGHVRALPAAGDPAGE